MLKRFFIVLLTILVTANIAHAAGTVPGFSLTPQFDQTGKIAPGCKLFVIQAGTVSTPQNAYQDTGLTSVLPNPLSCDASGRLPQWFVADGSIKLRLTTSTGVQIFVGDNLLVVGASSGGGGGGGSVDPTTILATGDIKEAYGTSILSGFVRCNGKTIGSATSGASERANSDTQALFQYLWSADPNLAVSGGRGAAANADWVANKTLTLPDCRDRTIAGLGDMGNTDAGRLTSTYWGSTGGCSSASPTVLGTACGSENETLTASQIPSISVSTSGTVSVFAGGSSNNFVPFAPGVGNTNNQATSPPGSGSTNLPSNAGAPFGFTASFSGSNTLTGSSTNTGGAPHPTIPPMILATIYIKL
jgi:hypothetical protein